MSCWTRGSGASSRTGRRLLSLLVLRLEQWLTRPACRPKQFAKNSLEDDEDDSNVGKLPPSESEDEEA